MTIEFPYLVGIALIEEGGKRVMPLGGKSIKENLNKQIPPREKADQIVLELLLRVMERSENSYIKRYAMENSFIIIQIPMKAMQEKLPNIKSSWINKGNTKELLRELNLICSGLWSINFTKQSGIYYKEINI